MDPKYRININESSLNQAANARYLYSDNRNQMDLLYFFKNIPLEIVFNWSSKERITKVMSRWSNLMLEVGPIFISQKRISHKIN